MPSTLKHKISYPSGTVAPNVPVVMQTQAESVDAALTALNGPWTALTLQNGWLAYVGGGSYYNGLRYRKVGDNLQISGMIKSGTNSVIATLPADARPPYAVIMFANSSGGAGNIQVDPTTGNITYMTGSPTTPSYLSINLFIPLS